MHHPGGGGKDTPKPLSSHTVENSPLMRDDSYVETSQDSVHSPNTVSMELGKLGKAIDALKALCREQGLVRVVAGGRMWGYSQFAGTAQQYVEAVQRGEVDDRVLTSQLRAGFEVRGILPGYLHDARSRSFATLLEWVCA